MVNRTTGDLPVLSLSKPTLVARRAEMHGKLAPNPCDIPLTREEEALRKETLTVNAGRFLAGLPEKDATAGTFKVGDFSASEGALGFQKEILARVEHECAQRDARLQPKIQRIVDKFCLPGADAADVLAMVEVGLINAPIAISFTDLRG